MSITMKFLLIVAAFLFFIGICLYELNKIRRSPNLQNPVEPTQQNEFLIQPISFRGLLAAYVVTDTKTGRRYLLNDEGGIVEMSNEVMTKELIK